METSCSPLSKPHSFIYLNSLKSCQRVLTFMCSSPNIFSFFPLLNFTWVVQGKSRQALTRLCFSVRFLKGFENGRYLSPGSYYLRNGSLPTVPEQTGRLGSPLLKGGDRPTSLPAMEGIGRIENGCPEKMATGACCGRPTSYFPTLCPARGHVGPSDGREAARG